MLYKEDLGTKFEIKIPALASSVDSGSAISDHCHGNEMLEVLPGPLCVMTQKAAWRRTSCPRHLGRIWVKQYHELWQWKKKAMVSFLFSFFNPHLRIIYFWFFLDRGREKHQGKRETLISYLPYAPQPEIEPRSRYVPRPKIEPSTFWCMECSNQLSYLFRELQSSFKTRDSKLSVKGLIVHILALWAT